MRVLFAALLLWFLPGRCRQLQRCFEVLDRMTAAGVPSNSVTYTCLIEAAVLSGDVDMAQRIFARAMAAGVTNSVQVWLPGGARHQGTVY
jgi:pentatricopeptide repeat protein